MDEKLHRKYRKVLEILPDVAECAKERLVLAGGTALALFHLKHRISIDLDFVPVEGDEVKLKEELKGCLSRKGYRTAKAAYSNQFVIHFEDTSIKIEVFKPEHKIGHPEKHAFGNATLLVAPLKDLLTLKEQSYADRKAGRDLFDIVFILKEQKAGFGLVERLITKHGAPAGMDEMKDMALNEDDYSFFRKVVDDASKAGN